MSITKVTSTPGAKTLRKLNCTKTILEVIGGTGGTILSRADIVADLAANGITSPNGNAAPDILGISILVQPNGNEVYDDATSALLTANGETVVVTENVERTAINGGGSEHYGGHLADNDCDGQPDDILASDFSLEIPEGSAVKLSIEVY